MQNEPLFCKFYFIQWDKMQNASMNSISSKKLFSPPRQNMPLRWWHTTAYLWPFFLEHGKSKCFIQQKEGNCFSSTFLFYFKNCISSPVSNGLFPSRMEPPFSSNFPVNRIQRTSSFVRVDGYSTVCSSGNQVVRGWHWAQFSLW